MESTATGKTDSTARELTDVPYISTEREQRFQDAGYNSPSDVALSEPTQVAEEVYGVGESTATTIIEGARELVGVDEPVVVEDDEDEDELEEPDDEAEAPEEVTAEMFERRLITRDVKGDGTEMWYRDPETESLITPYEAPGFEAWCEKMGRDPESFRS